MTDERTMLPARPLSRRQLLAGVGGLVAVTLVPLRASAMPEDLAAALVEEFGTADIAAGRVELTLPALSENGNSVALEVRVESPMTETDHVTELHVFAEKNPLPRIARFRLSPDSGVARVATRIRLADSQTVTAVARMSDGSLWSGSAHIIVTLAACLDLS